MGGMAFLETVRYLEKYLGITKYLLHLQPVKKGQGCYYHHILMLKI